MTDKYRIAIKRDFGKGKGFWLPGAGDVGTMNYGYVKSGFVVLKQGCNCMPGATWFRTVAEAMIAIKAHMEVGHSSQFWDKYKEIESAHQ